MAFIFTLKSTILMAILSITILFFSLPCMILSADIDATMRSFKVPSGGPESFIFAKTGGFYTGVNDGRVVFNKGHDNLVDFAYASPNRYYFHDPVFYSNENHP